ncbi:MAG: hypothetical protein JXX28_12990 [Deltaproteobacteria bacterium]|nr:hypothetical protein [Deltaproteobacteria bacterium]
MVLRTLPLLILAACVAPRDPEDPSGWYASGDSLDVEEYVAFTDQPYPDFGAENTIADFNDAVFPTKPYTLTYGPEEVRPEGTTCQYAEDRSLPMEIEGVVTLHPRYYFKTMGCDNGDEKFYGNYFIEDATGGAFILGDSKVAHFGMGDRVRLKVRGVRTTFDLNMVYAHDVVEVTRGPFPIYYSEPSGPLGADDVAKVQRVTGTVLSEKDDFGAFRVESDNGTTYDVSLDAELSRRGVGWYPGDRITVTGPVIYSYSAYSIIIMRKGQVQVLD